MGIRQLDGQTAWIGGGALGMGAAASELLAREGANVAVVDIGPLHEYFGGGSAIILAV